MKTAFFPGKFNPPHIGHLRTIAKILKRTDGIFLIIGVSGHIPENSLMTQEEIVQVMTELVPEAWVVPFEGTLVKKKSLEGLPAFDVLLTGNQEVVEWGKSMGVEVEIVERTEGILSDSSQIRDKLGHGNINFVEKNVKNLPIKDLLRYEKHSPSKTALLKNKIHDDGHFTNPITVTREDLVVIDGANRLEAVRELGFTHIPCMLVNYDDVILKGNTHYFDFDYKEPPMLVRAPNESDLELKVRHYNKIVQFYKTRPVYRLSEGARSLANKIEFEPFTKEEIVYLAKNKIMLESGITWHNVGNTVINLEVPLRYLQLGRDIQTVIADNKNNTRYYSSGVYTCNEWR